MIARAISTDTFAGLTLDINLGKAGFREAAIYVPALTTDTYVTVALSYDGSTYLTLSVGDGAGSEYDVEIPSAKVRVIPIAGAKYIRLTAPATSQTATVVSIAI
ncbi:hypothetical protein LCGC14_1570340 [marine sediment metagenome]|uniref:Uncharacterized protein n=1 Tax=marine sediment metagenome TaxID=412755 RepID=A0A0F9J668_9ZZZZ